MEFFVRVPALIFAHGLPQKMTNWREQVGAALVPGVTSCGWTPSPHCLPSPQSLVLRASTHTKNNFCRCSNSSKKIYYAGNVTPLKEQQVWTWNILSPHSPPPGSLWIPPQLSLQPLLCAAQPMSFYDQQRHRFYLWRELVQLLPSPQLH